MLLQIRREAEHPSPSPSSRIPPLFCYTGRKSVKDAPDEKRSRSVGVGGRMEWWGGGGGMELGQAKRKFPAAHCHVCYSSFVLPLSFSFLAALPQLTSPSE